MPWLAHRCGVVHATSFDNALLTMVRLEMLAQSRKNGTLGPG